MQIAEIARNSSVKETPPERPMSNLAGPATVSKSDFARLCSVTPGRVTQWISEKKLTGSALVGEGRSARIRPDIGQAQVGLRRDIGQSLGNGISTRLSTAATLPQSRAVDEDDAHSELQSTSDAIDRKLKLAKLEASERANRLAAIEEAAADGVYVEAASVRSEMTQIAVEMVKIYEGAIPDIATALASAFKLEARDVTHLLIEELRKVRDKAATRAASAAALSSELVGATAN